MKRLCRLVVLSLLLAGCAVSRPEQEIAATFQTFLAGVRAGEQTKIIAAAPFLSDLPSDKRETAIKSFRPFALADPKTLIEKIRRSSASTYLLAVSIRGEKGALVIPFRRDRHGHWTMSPVVEEVQHVDIVPAR